MSSEQDFKKLSTSSGGGYKPIQELEDKLSEVKAETSKERALRQKLERQAEFKYTEEDNARWSNNRNKTIEENGTSDIYEGINKAKEAIINFFNPKIGGEVPPFNLEEVLANPEIEAITAVNIDPPSMLVDDMVSLASEGENFIHNPTLGGLATMATIAIPGKFVDEPLEKLSKKYLGNGSHEWVDLSDIRYTQSTISINSGDGTPVLNMAYSMKSDGWDTSKGAADLIKLNDGYMTLDHRRLVAADWAGLEKIPGNVHGFNELLPDSITKSPRYEHFASPVPFSDVGTKTTIWEGDLPKTFGQAGMIRSLQQQERFGQFPLTGNHLQPKFTFKNENEWAKYINTLERMKN